MNFLRNTFFYSIIHKIKNEHFVCKPSINYKGDIVYIGDSITSGIDCKYKIAFPGKTSGYIQKSIKHCSGSIVFLLVGINDLFNGYSPDHVASNIRKITKKINGKIVLQSVIYCNCETVNIKIKATNKLIKKLSQELNLEYVDLNKNLSINEKINPALTSDGVHLNKLGYKALKLALNNFNVR